VGTGGKLVFGRIRGREKVGEGVNRVPRAVTGLRVWITYISFKLKAKIEQRDSD